MTDSDPNRPFKLAGANVRCPIAKRPFAPVISQTADIHKATSRPRSSSLVMVSETDILPAFLLRGVP
jgi:hypothetical protein